MTVMLGYNVLFQDADIVWYKNPLDYFENENSQIDVFFQDDGSRSLFYSPYSANTGTTSMAVYSSVEINMDVTSTNLECFGSLL